MSDLPLAITHGASLANITDSVSRASSITPLHYVERRGALFRWSPAHRGGPYPLLRTVAKVLDLDYHRLVVACSALPDSPICIVPVTEATARADAWTVLEFDQPTHPDEVRQRIVAALYD